MPRARFSSLIVLFLGVLSPDWVSSVQAQQDPAVGRAVQFLRGRAGREQVGETALIALAMLKAEVPPGDPAVAQCVAKLRARFLSTGYSPERSNGLEIYEAAVVGMAMSNLNAETSTGGPELEAVASYIMGKQNSNGSWDYNGRPNGDSSISQYALLGLWEAENGGVRVPPQIWDKAAQWYMSVQASGGSWNYHRDEAQRYPETVSMTAAGVGSLLICKRQLARYRRGNETSTSNLLKPVAGEDPDAKYEPETSGGKIDQAVKRGLAWLGSNFSATAKGLSGQSPFYALYGIERIGALAERETLGRVNWFDQGRHYILGAQRSDGAWDATHGDVANTAWAILFLTKSTAKTIRRVDIKRLGAGTLLGGRGLPKDLSNLTVAGGRVVSRPLSGAVEGMLAVLEDPRAENADAALTGLVARYRRDGAKAIRPFKDRFRKMLTDRDPGVRRVAAWALARSEDLDVVPSLINALTDGDESVVVIAAEGLQLLSRKIASLGPPPHSTPDQRQEAARRWREWYLTIRPIDVEGQEDELSAATNRSAR